MVEQHFSGELERALARPHIESMRLHLADYRDYMEDVAGSSLRNDSAGNFNYVSDAHRDQDVALAYVMLALSEYDDPYFIGLIAAGPLEDVLMFNLSRELVDRVVAEAKRTPRFRWMVKQIYFPKAEWAREALQEATRGVSLADPLPEL